jgi:uncharacterized membrane protein YeaQ/YmgE (transglycosylase-associated protein family)
LARTLVDEGAKGDEVVSHRDVEAVAHDISRAPRLRVRPHISRRSTTMGILAWIVLGAIAGFLANMIFGGNEGVIGTILLGIVGAVVGGFLAGTVLKVADVTGLNIESIVVSVIGAIVVLAAWRMFSGRRATA